MFLFPELEIQLHDVDKDMTIFLEVFFEGNISKKTSLDYYDLHTQENYII